MEKEMELILYAYEVEEKLKEFIERTHDYRMDLVVEARYKQYDEETKSMCVMEVNLVDVEGEVIDSFICTAGAWLSVLEKKFR